MDRLIDKKQVNTENINKINTENINQVNTENNNLLQKFGIEDYKRIKPPKTEEEKKIYRKQLLNEIKRESLQEKNMTHEQKSINAILKGIEYMKTRFLFLIEKKNNAIF